MNIISEATHTESRWDNFKASAAYVIKFYWAVDIIRWIGTWPCWGNENPSLHDREISPATGSFRNKTKGSFSSPIQHTQAIAEAKVKIRLSLASVTEKPTPTGKDADIVRASVSMYYVKMSKLLDQFNGMLRREQTLNDTERIEYMHAINQYEKRYIEHKTFIDKSSFNTGRAQPHEHYSHQGHRSYGALLKKLKATLDRVPST